MTDQGCEGCMFWSVMVAEVGPDGMLRAMCLHDSMERVPFLARLRYGGCDQYEEGPAMDHPGRQGELH